ncbi:unnamed protein product [Arabidopsis halleri]
MHKLDLIRENLFLGDICAAAEILKNGSFEISHVLTVLHCPSISVFEEWPNVKLDSKEIKEVTILKFSREDDLASLKQHAHATPSQRAHAFETPKYKAKVGSFDWSGSYCSCGSKIVPAFQIQKSRVDVITAKDDVKKKHKKKRV